MSEFYEILRQVAHVIVYLVAFKSIIGFKFPWEKKRKKKEDDGVVCPHCESAICPNCSSPTCYCEE